MPFDDGGDKLRIWPRGSRLSAILCVLALLAAPVVLLPQAPAIPAIPGSQKIQHVVWIIQENHSYDNYFGTFPGADGIPPSTCLPKMPGSKACVKPFHMPPGQALLAMRPARDASRLRARQAAPLRPRRRNENFRNEAYWSFRINVSNIPGAALDYGGRRASHKWRGKPAATPQVS